MQSHSAGNFPKKCLSSALGISSRFPGETASRFGGGSRNIQYQSVLLDINFLSIVQVFLTDANKMTSWTMQFSLLVIKKIKDGKSKIHGVLAGEKKDMLGLNTAIHVISVRVLSIQFQHIIKDIIHTLINNFREHVLLHDIFSFTFIFLFLKIIFLI